MKGHVTILGDRQSGRSTLALLAAIQDGQDGRRVLYEVSSNTEATEMLRQGADLAYRLCPDSIDRVNIARGRQEIRFKGEPGPSSRGGSILFWSSYHRPPTDRPDTHILDGVPYTEVHPNATRSIRVVLR